MNMWEWRQRRAWGTERMRQELRTRFLHYARTFGSQRGLEHFENAIEQSPNLYVYFAGRHAGYVHEWVLRGAAATVGHFAVARELEGKGFGEPLLRGFAESVQRELGVARIVFRVRKFSPAYQQLFQRVGAIATGRVVYGIPEWEWCFPKP
ncbi:hypothetical protein SE336_15615 [Xanthomonas arboricola]|uniref:hypothetical protein n=1 Tax=Xanthomonas arboricola TaxID=56448 RepID=UPI0039F5D211